MRGSHPTEPSTHYEHRVEEAKTSTTCMHIRNTQKTYTQGSMVPLEVHRQFPQRTPLSCEQIPALHVFTQTNTRGAVPALHVFTQVFRGGMFSNIYARFDGPTRGPQTLLQRTL